MPLPAGYVGDIRVAGDRSVGLTAAADMAGRIELLDSSMRRRLQTLQTSAPGATGLALAANGAVLATLHHDGVVRLWDTKTAEVRRSWQACPEHYKEESVPVWLSPDGRRLATSGQARGPGADLNDQGVKVWDAVSGREVWHHRIPGQFNRIDCVIFCPDGKRLVGATEGPNSVTAKFDDGCTATADVLIGADGVRSTVRTLIDPKAPGAGYTGMLSFQGYVDAAPDLDPEPGVMTFAFGKRVGKLLGVHARELSVQRLLVAHGQSRRHRENLGRQPATAGLHAVPARPPAAPREAGQPGREPAPP